MKLSDKLQRLKEENVFSKVTDIARKAKVSKTSCYRWYNGESYPEVREALRLSRAMGVPLEWLADDAAAFPPPSEDLPEDERQVLKMYRYQRSQGLGEEEAISRLSGVLVIRSGGDVTHSVRVVPAIGLPGSARPAPTPPPADSVGVEPVPLAPSTVLTDQATAKSEAERAQFEGRAAKTKPARAPERRESGSQPQKKTQRGKGER